jgi:CysZ protein
MIQQALLGLAQLNDPRVRRIVWLSVAITVASLTVLVLLAWEALNWVTFFEDGTLEWLADLVAGLGATILVILLTPAVVGLASSFFLEGVADAVEARHYPALPPGREQPIAEAVVLALRFTGLVLGVNLLALPLYFIPPLNLFVFYGLNGYLLSKEYYQLVALRRLDRAGARAVWRRGRGRFFLAGLLIAGLASVPVAGLLTPVVATAFMVHVFETARQRALRRGDIGDGNSPHGGPGGRRRGVRGEGEADVPQETGK